MYVAYLAGGIGSGKSTAAAELEELGCARIDLDQLSREVLAPESPLLADIAEVFGADVLDDRGQLNRGRLAERAFATEESAARLEELELPAIRDLLAKRLSELECSGDAECCIVEVPLLDRMVDSLDDADEVVVVWCPIALRRERAIGRGMRGEDFDARAARQPSDAWLREHATTLLDNTAGRAELSAQVRNWFDRHAEEGWT